MVSQQHKESFDRVKSQTPGDILIALNMALLENETVAKHLVPVHSSTKKEGSSRDTRKTLDTKHLTQGRHLRDPGGLKYQWHLLHDTC